MRMKKMIAVGAMTVAAAGGIAVGTSSAFAADCSTLMNDARQQLVRHNIKAAPGISARQMADLLRLVDGAEAQAADDLANALVARCG